MNLPGVIGAGEPAASVFALARPACGSSRVNWLIGKDGPCPEIIFKENKIMGLLDSVVSAVGGSDPQLSGQAGLLPALIEQVNKYPGGLAGLIDKFQEGGLGDVLASWVGTGQNHPGSRAEEHPSELQSLMRTPYAVFS